MTLRLGIGQQMAQWGCRSDAHPAVECRYRCGTASAVGSNQLGHHVAFKHTHAAATFPLRSDPDDSLERFLDAEANKHHPLDAAS